MDFRGTYTALVTPFSNDANASIDWPAFDVLVDTQIDGGIAGLVPCGTTGECPTLSHTEMIDLYARTVKQARGRAQVIAGTGSNSTAHAIDLSQAAEKAGVDAVMVVVPYYNKPTQDGLVAHYCAIAASVKCPVVVYNIPARTGIDLSADALVRICEKAKNLVACKEATGNVLRAQELSRRLGDRLQILSGDDALTLPMISVGAKGVISVTSNLLPLEVADATNAALDGDRLTAKKLHLALLPVHEAMFVEANPSPVKWALAEKKKMNNVVRAPLVPVSDSSAKKIAAVLDAHARGRDKGR
ncbi:MAG: 4-hydroxy-tetrahydrodipicolinate synthase [Polyangiaceae bacterium]